MKTLLKIVGAIVGCLIVLLVVLRITGFPPHDRTPGLWLSGHLVTTPVSDWSFANKYETDEIQTNTGYWIPHSVTTYLVSYQGQLYVDSLYRAGLKYPDGRSWNKNVARDPHVRIKLGDQLYDATLVHITDPALFAAVLQAKLEKYPDLKVPRGGSVQIFHVVQDGAPQTPTSN
jgi:hypothetical protein